MDQTELNDNIKDLTHQFLIYDTNAKGIQPKEENSICIKTQKDVEKCEQTKPILIAVIGQKFSGKSFLIQNIGKRYKYEGNDVLFHEVPFECKSLIMDKALIIIYIVNDYGHFEQKQIDAIYAAKRKVSKLVVVFNFHTIRTLDQAPIISRKMDKISTLYSTHEEKEPYAYADKVKANTFYYMLLNNIKKNNLAYQHLDQFITNTLAQYSLMPPVYKRPKDLNAGDQPEYTYYSDNFNNKFYIEIELCGDVKDLLLAMKLKDELIYFRITGVKDQVIKSNKVKNYGPFTIEFTLPYERATIKSFVPIQKYAYKDGVAIFSLDLLDQNYLKLFI